MSLNPSELGEMRPGPKIFKRPTGRMMQAYNASAKSLACRRHKSHVNVVINTPKSTPYRNHCDRRTLFNHQQANNPENRTINIPKEPSPNPPPQLRHPHCLQSLYPHQPLPGTNTPTPLNPLPRPLQITVRQLCNDPLTLALGLTNLPDLLHPQSPPDLLPRIELLPDQDVVEPDPRALRFDLSTDVEE